MHRKFVIIFISIINPLAERPDDIIPLWNSILLQREKCVGFIDKIH